MTVGKPYRFNISKGYIFKTQPLQRHVVLTLGSEGHFLNRILSWNPLAWKVLGFHGTCNGKGAVVIKLKFLCNSDIMLITIQCIYLWKCYLATKFFTLGFNFLICKDFILYLYQQLLVFTKYQLKIHQFLPVGFCFCFMISEQS